MGTYTSVNKRKIIYVTGTRADYGLIRLLLKKLNADADIELSLCVTGMHLSSLYGNTVEEIRTDNFKICGDIFVDADKSSKSSMAQSIGHQIIGMTELFEREQPDIVLLLGDRGEMIAGAIAAVHLNIPIVHIHGGERSGTVDEMVRHAISKLAHYHFVATKFAKDRLVKMGEVDEHVFVVGAPGLDEIHAHHVIDSDLFYSRYRLSTNKKIGLLIYHPVVQEYDEIKFQFINAIEAALENNLQVICLEPNSDAGGHLIREALKQYFEHPEVRIIKHLIREDFIDCLANAHVMIGNSSSGIIEAASFNLNVVNIGTRQNLRERSENVIEVDPEVESISLGIKQALKREPQNYINCYGDGKSSERCYQLLKSLALNNHLLNKCNAY
jgi:GDP/UDP-N,N'-diacetylbacillosamine 2-epimerase (hydrolysing)